MQFPLHDYLILAHGVNYHVSTVHELTQEVTVDPAVRKHLARHFHITETQLISYIRSNLVLRQLKSAGVYRVACVRPEGTEYWVQSRLHAGTQIFASRATGQPVLKLACGNPMVSVLPSAPKVAAFTGAASQPKLVAAAIEEKMAAVPPPALLPNDVPLKVGIISDDFVQAPPVVKVAGSLETLGNFASAVAPISSSGSFNFLPALAGIGAAVGILHNNSSSPSAPSPGPITAPVPEASTLISLGFLLLAGGLVVWRQRRVTKRSVS